MASSFIDYKNKGIWFRDGLLRYAFMYVHQEMMNHFRDNEWIESMADLVKDNTRGYFSGFMHFDFDEFLNAPEKHEKFLSILDNTIEVLSSKEADIKYQR